MSDLFKKNISLDDIKIYKLKEVSEIKRYKGRQLEEKVISLEIKEEDHYLAKVIKELINNANITNKDIYDKIGYTKGYNMLYGLSRDRDLTWARVQDWADVLELDIDISVKPREE